MWENVDQNNSEYGYFLHSVVLKKTHQALGLFDEKCPEKHEAFKCPLTTLPLAVSKLAEKLYQPKTKYQFRKYFIELSKAKVSERNSNPIVIYDARAIVRSVPS